MLVYDACCIPMHLSSPAPFTHPRLNLGIRGPIPQAIKPGTNTERRIRERLGFWDVQAAARMTLT